MKVELSNAFATDEYTSRSKVTAAQVSSTNTGALDSTSFTPRTQSAGSLVGTSTAASSTSVAAQDQTGFTPKTQSVTSLVGTAMKTPTIRQNRVDELKSSIASGDYKLDANKIAGAIISEGGQ